MNKICLNGVIKDIEHSHDIGNISYDKAKLITKRLNGKEDIIDLKFKSLSNKYNYKNNDKVSLIGNVRSYSEHENDEQSLGRVSIYVFTYFDLPTTLSEEETNRCEITGKVCKIDPIRTTKDGKKNVHLILANNIKSKNGTRLSSYIPCIVWGKIAESIQNVKVNDDLKILGELHSREHKKYFNDTEYELRVAHELFIKEFELIEGNTNEEC